jgi:hypothetical protein
VHTVGRVDARIAPPLSVVVPTCAGWPAIAPCLARLRPSAEAAGAEVLVADGSRRPPPPPEARWPGLAWLAHPGAGVFALRARARQAARGEILAVTEDHCLVAPDWCRRILEAHDRHRDAVAVKGAVRNGTAARLLDRVSYLVSQAPHLPPFGARDEDAGLGISCTSYRRAALDRLAPDPDWPVELVDARRWRAGGAAVVADESIWVEHLQSGPLLALSALHFHNGRAIAGLRRTRASGRDVLRLAGLAVLPLVRTARTARLCARKGVAWSTLGPGVPLFLWFYLWKAAGEAAGYLAGPGDSATRLA